jgi:hypothetical protein
MEEDSMRLMTVKFCLLFSFFAYGIFAQSSLENILSPARLPYLKKSKLYQISSFDSTGANADRLVLSEGQTATIADMEGPGVITRIWITIASRDPYFLRRIVLRIYWDGEENPSVEVPVGDFFGTGFEYRQYLSHFVGMSSGGYFCYFPMPFQKSARIEVENHTGRVVDAFYYHIDYQKLEEQLPQDVAYFHAFWRREIKTDPDLNYTILEAAGRGHFIGCNMSMQSYRGNLWFLEGDEMVYVDGETFPSVYGTGTEDYFTSGWYFNRGEYAGPYHGLILKDDSLGRIAAYRFHIGDVIPFKKSLRFTIEHGHANEEVGDYSSTAYWYQKEPHQPFPEMLKASLRIPLRVVVPHGAIEAEGLTVTNTALDAVTEDMSPYGADWSGFRQLKILAKQPGDQFSLAILEAIEDRYIVDVYFSKGPDYGDVEIYYRDQKIGEYSGYHPEVFPGGKVRLSNLRTIDNAIPLRFVVSGKQAKSAGYAVGIDAFFLEPDRRFIPQWYMIGPFPNPKDEQHHRLGLDNVYPPETEIDLKKAYIGAENQEVRWELKQSPENGHIDLYRKYDPFELVIVYALTYIYSPKEQEVPLLLGTDDGVEVFLNDQPVHEVLEIRIARVDEDRVPLKLKKGWNKLLLKIENNLGGYGFYARVLDLGNSLIISAEKEK